MRTLGIAGLLVLLGCWTAAAADVEGEIYGIFGAAKIETLDVGYNLGGGGGVLFGDEIKVGFNVEGQVINSSETLLGVDLDLDIALVVLNLVLEGGGIIRPYFVVGGGYANTDVSGSAGGVTISLDLSDDSVFDSGGGVKFVVNDHFMVAGDFRYFRISDVNVARAALLVGGKF